ncbi:MAG: 50S ribosomal protein L9 [Planctomycetes bacterium]|nr:50S ribosomal protein L9 [Planctomycetota bacterium]
MQLLLNKNIEHLGRIGEIVTVKPGYARNYLLPMGLAVPVTKANLAQIEKVRERAVAEERQRLESMREFAAKVEQTSVTIEGRANDDGHLFGSVAATQIAHALQEKGITVEAKTIRLDHPIKEIGVYDVVVHLHPEVDATVKVWVVQSKPA